MATPDEIFLPDGTILEVQSSSNPSTWIQVSDPVSIPAIGETAEFVNVESISDTAPKYKATTGEAEDFAIQCNYVESANGTRDPGQAELMMAAKARVARNLRVTIPGIAKILQFNITFGSWSFDQLEKKSAIKITFSGRKNGTVQEVTPSSKKGDK